LGNLASRYAATTELLLKALGDLALHSPDEVFPPEPFGYFTDPDWFIQ